MGFDEELERIFELGTTHAAKALRIDRDYGIEEGKRADLVVLEAPSVPEAIRLQPRRRAVIKRGKLVVDQGRFVSETTLR